MRIRWAVFNLAVLGMLVAVACGGAEPTATSAPTNTPQPAATATQAPSPSPTLAVGQPTNIPAPTVTRPAPTATPASPTSTPGVRPKTSGLLTGIGFASPATLDMYNPAGSFTPFQFVVPIYNTLMRTDRITHVTSIDPSLASSWDFDSSGTQITLKLRKDVKWHDGAAFTADDVVYTLLRGIKPPDGVSIGSFNPTFLQSVASVQALDASTVKLTLSFPDPVILQGLAFPGMLIYPKRILQSRDEAKKPMIDADLIGTGPFVFKADDVGVSWEVAKNPAYWDKDASGQALPYLDGIKTFVIVDDSASFAAFRTKQVLQAKPSNRGILPQQYNLAIESMKGKADIRVYRSLGQIGAKSINVQVPPFNDKRVRQALSLALDRQAFRLAYGPLDLTYLTGPIDSKGTWGIPVTDVEKLPGYRSDKTADIEEAKRLLKAAGIPDGFKFKVLTSAGASADDASLAVDQWRKIGLDPSLDVVSLNGAADKEIRGDFAISFRAWTDPLDDPNIILMAKAYSKGTENFGKYANPTLETLFEQQQREFDLTKRKELVRKIQDVMIDDVPLIKLIQRSYVQATWLEVKDMHLGPGLHYGFGDFDYIWLDR